MSESRFKNEAGKGDLIFIKPADLFRAEFKGVAVEGLLISSQPNGLNPNVLDFKLEADTDLVVEGVDKDGKRYTTSINSGDTVIVNGAGNLNYLMKDVNPGGLCQISYNGKVLLSKGPQKGKEAHNFKVMY